MAQEHQARPRFDPQAALEELERFGRDIQRYRAQRQAVGEEFETFVRSFKTPPESAGVEDPVAPPPSREIPTYPAQVAPPPATEHVPARGEPVQPVVPVEPLPPVATLASVESRAAVEPVAPVEPVSPPVTLTEPVTDPGAAAAPVTVTEPVRTAAAARRPTAAIAAGVLVVALGGLLAAFLWNRSPAPDPAATADAPAVPAPAPEPSPAPAPAAAAPVTATLPPNDAEILTERQVWMRVIVDGNKVLEREVPAGTTIPLKVEKTIVVRTGDAGAVRLSLRGAPGALLGREGEVVTRAFNLPPKTQSR